MKKLQTLLFLLLSCHAAFAQAPQLDSAFAYFHAHALFKGMVL